MARIDAGAVATRIALGASVGDRRRRARSGGAHAAAAPRSTCDVDPDVPVQLDPRLTATALAHLLENAAQYSPAGSVDHGDRPRDRRRARRSRCAIRGPGIAPADCRAPVRAVLPGRGGDDPRVRDRAWAWRSRAACWPSNAAGSGRRIIPTAARSSRSSCRPPHAGPLSRESGDDMTQPARILLVDDEVSIQRALGPLLRIARLRRRDRRRPGPRRSGCSATGRPTWSCSIWDCRISRARKCAGAFARRRPCRSSCCRRAARKPTR